MRAALVVSNLLAAYARAARKGLLGEYGFLSDFDGLSEDEARARVRAMSTFYGIKEFEFYNAFQGYSMPPPGELESWHCNVLNTPVRRKIIEAYTDEISKLDPPGRSWVAVGAMSVDPGDAAIHGITNKLGDYKIRTQPVLDIVAPNAAWAQRITDEWARWAIALGFSGIHWSTMAWQGQEAGVQAFLQTAKGLLAKHGLEQTCNVYDSAAWHNSLSVVAFPYLVSTDVPNLNTFKAEGGGVFVALAGKDATHAGELSANSQKPVDILIDRWKKARCTGNAYLAIGDGGKRQTTDYLLAAESLTEAEIKRIRSAVFDSLTCPNGFLPKAIQIRRLPKVPAPVPMLALRQAQTPAPTSSPSLTALHTTTPTVPEVPAPVPTLALRQAQTPAPTSSPSLTALHTTTPTVPAVQERGTISIETAADLRWPSIKFHQPQITNCFVSVGFRSVNLVALMDGNVATVAQRRRLNVIDKVSLRFDSMPDMSATSRKSFGAALVSSLVEAGLSFEELALLHLGSNLSAHVVEIRGPPDVLKSVRQATALNFSVAGLIGRPISPAATRKQIYVTVTCTIACPFLTVAQMTSCMQGTFPGLAIQQATYAPFKSVRSGSKGNQSMFKGPPLDMHTLPGFLTGVRDIPFWSDFSSHDQAALSGWVLLPLCILFCGSTILCHCKRKAETTFESRSSASAIPYVDEDLDAGRGRNHSQQCQEPFLLPLEADPRDWLGVESEYTL